MASVPTSRSSQHKTTNGDDSITATLPQIETLLDEMPDRMFDSDYYERLATELRRFHARLRVHHAANELNICGQLENHTPPELLREQGRLQDEHTTMLGNLDRIIRCTDALADQTIEDKEVFFLRVRELIATVRRHEAEEDRLFYLAVWRETGGEC